MFRIKLGGTKVEMLSRRLVYSDVVRRILELNQMFRLACLLLIPLAALTTEAQTQPRAKARVNRTPRTVNFCDFTVHPKLYAGKLVRVKATLVGWWESSYLYSPDCETDAKKIHNGLDCSGKRDCERVGDAVHDAIERVGKPAEYDSYKADLVIIGRLVGPSRIGFGHLNGFKYEFRIRRIESEPENSGCVRASHGTTHNNSLDRSGGSVFRVKRGAAKVAEFAPPGQL